MLELTRRKSEGFMVGDDVHITVMKISGGQVRIGIEAPRNVLVVRDELIGVGDGGAASPVEQGE